MEIEIKNHPPFWLFFRYSEENGKKKTTCFINQDKVELAQSSVVCHVKDRFERAKGRKLSLKTTLELLPLNKEERAEFWKIYNTRVNPPKITINLLDYLLLVEDACAYRAIKLSKV
jgi:hypothetical protein